jgi:formylglycine-generating enzyme required for sulfatase activity
VITVNERGNIINRENREAQTYDESLAKGLVLPLVYIPAGSFTMGSPTSEVGRQDNEEPQRQVTVPAFWMGQYAVTQAQYQAIMGENPSHFKAPNRPVEQVSWHQAAKFCQKLSKRTGLHYRLPSEAEWEYACRAGTTTPFHFGPTLTTDLANYNGHLTYGNGPTRYRRETLEVGHFSPNAFGLYEMHGNVREWCSDPWHDTYQGSPTGTQDWIQAGEADRCVLRGGSWSYVPELCRSAYRDWGRPTLTRNDIGFRVVYGGAR